MDVNEGIISGDLVLRHLGGQAASSQGYARKVMVPGLLAVSSGVPRERAGLKSLGL